MAGLDLETWKTKLAQPEYNQGPLLTLLEEKDPKQLKLLVDQLNRADRQYPGGLKGYLAQTRKLLQEATQDVNPFEGYVLEEPLIYEALTDRVRVFLEYEKLGLTQLGKVVFVLVAGGMGERLGYPEIKLKLPVESVTRTSYLEYYCKLIQASQNLSSSKQKLPLVIMTSEDTHSPTVAFLEDNKFFGLEPAQVHLVMQDKVPAVADIDGHLAVFETPDGQLRLEMKPHGHGDVHSLVYSEGWTSKWLDQGYKWVFFFQDTNALVAHSLAVMLGVSEYNHLHMNSLVVPRRSGEAMGAVCAFKKDEKCTDSKHLRPAFPEKFTVNVEYNVLDNLLSDKSMRKQATASPSEKNSPYPGNTNILCLDLEYYHGHLRKTSGKVPEFINPKFADATRATFKSSARLECMMQDLPKAFGPEAKVGCTLMDRWLCFSTVKNHTEEAVKKIATGIPPECMLSGEADFYHANAQLLHRALKYKCPSAISNMTKTHLAQYARVQYPLGPRVILSPSFGFCFSQIVDRLQNCSSLQVTENSVLILDGPVVLSNLNLDGCLKVYSNSRSKLELNNLNLKNRGCPFYALTEDNKPSLLPPDVERKGYFVVHDEVTEIASKEIGEHEA